MLRFLGTRLAGTLPVLLLISLLIFMLVHLAPGDPASLLVSDDASPADVERLRKLWGLDQPPIIQYLRFLWASVHGEFGTSFRFGEPVISLVAQHLPATLELATLSILFAVVIGLPLGVIAGARPNSWIDNVASVTGFFGISMPGFWMAIVLILVISGDLDLLPTAGRSTVGLGGPPITGLLLLDSLLHGDLEAFHDGLAHLALPVLTLGTNMIGLIMRVTRSSVLEIGSEDYIVTALAKGLPERTVLWRHVLKNALVVIITVVGLEFGGLLSGSIVIESVFSWPGLGSLLVEGMHGRDYPMITGLVLVYTTMFVTINLLMDLCYAVIDPRLRYD